MAIVERFKNAWNAFASNKDPTKQQEYEEKYTYDESSGGYWYRPDRSLFTRGNDRSIITSVYNKIAVDGASVDFRHVQLDDEGRFIREIDSDLNNCLKVEANIDQSGREFIQDAVQSMLDEGCVALVPVDTDVDPWDTEGFKIGSIRTGKIIKWFPAKVTVRLYNDRTGRHEDITLPKRMVSIVENPFYSVMNEKNSTAQRLIRKLAILDVVDEQKGSNKLDMIIQLPYIIKTEARRQQAENRRKDIEMQLSSSKYGIAYTDGTEKITQLNRSVDNQLQTQVEYLTRMLLSQLGMTEEILNGTAGEEVMTNYYNRIIEPILCAISEGMYRKFLSRTARSKGQSIKFFRDHFKLVPISKMADLGDRLTRNEIMSSNEFRQKLGMKPSDQPGADELRNKNIAQDLNGDGIPDEEPEDEMSEEDYNSKMEELENLDKQFDEIENMFGGD